MRTTFLDINNNVDRLASGDFSAQITNDYKGAFAVTKVAVNALGTNLNNLIIDSNMMNAEALNGNLDVSIDDAKYQGDFGKISGGINAFAEQMRTTFLDINNNVDRLANGDFSAQITNDYKGAFEVTKVAVNALGTNLNNLIIDSNTINERAQKGVFDIKIDVQKYQGDFNKISSGINGFVFKAEETRVYYEKTKFIRDGVSQLNTIIAINNSFESLAMSAMNFVARYSDSGVGGLYIAKAEIRKISLASAYAQKPFAQEFDYGDGIVGQVALENKTIILRNLAQGQTLISSASLSMIPNMLIAFPLIYKEELIAVLELATHTFYEDKVFFLFICI